MFRFSLSCGLSKGSGLSSGWPLKRGSTVLTYLSCSFTDFCCFIAWKLSNLNLHAGWLLNDQIYHFVCRCISLPCRSSQTFRIWLTTCGYPYVWTSRWIVDTSASVTTRGQHCSTGTCYLCPNCSAVPILIFTLDKSFLWKTTESNIFFQIKLLFIQYNITIRPEDIDFLDKGRKRIKSESSKINIK